MEYWSNYEQTNACQSYWQGNPHSNFYNENPRNEPDFSWTSNVVPTPPFHPTYHEPYNQPYQPTHQQPYQSTYQEPYQPPYQPTYQEPYPFPYQYSDPHMPNFQQAQQYTPPQPQPTTDLSRLEALLTHHLEAQVTFQQQFQATLKTQEEELNQFMLHRKEQEALLAQIAASSSMRQPENLPPQEQQPHEIVNAITLRSGIDHNIPKMSEDDEVDDHSAVVDALEAALYGTEPIRGQSETVSELVHKSKAIEVKTSESQSEAIEVNNLKLKFSPSDLNIYMLNDNEDCFIIKDITLSEPNPYSLIVSNVYIHETPLEKGRLFCIQGQGKLKLTIQVVAKEEVHPERDGTKRGTKRCWDPGGSFDKIRLVPWARKRDFGNRFGGANGRGTQDDYDNPGGEQVTMHSIAR